MSVSLLYIKSTQNTNSLWLQKKKVEWVTGLCFVKCSEILWKQKKLNLLFGSKAKNFREKIEWRFNAKGLSGLIKQHILNWHFFPILEAI